jgi:hypothetical protein
MIFHTAHAGKDRYFRKDIIGLLIYTQQNITTSSRVYVSTENSKPAMKALMGKRVPK